MRRKRIAGETLKLQSKSQETLYYYTQERANRLFAYFLSQGFSREDAEDSTQEVWTKALRNRYQESRGTPTTFLLTIARSIFRDALRYAAAQRRPRLISGEAIEEFLASIPDSVYDPVTRAEQQAVWRWLLQQMTEYLPNWEEDVELMGLRYALDLPYREIASRMAITEDTARQRHREVLLALRTRIPPLWAEQWCRLGETLLERRE